MDNNFNDIPTPVKSNKEIMNEANEVNELKEDKVNVVDDTKAMIKKEGKTMIVFLKDLFKYITTKKISDLSELLIYALIIVGFIIAIGIPFGFLKEVIFNVLVTFGINFGAAIREVIENALNLFYYVIALVLFLVLCREKFYQLVRNKKEIEDLKKEINS